MRSGRRTRTWATASILPARRDCRASNAEVARIASEAARAKTEIDVGMRRLYIARTCRDTPCVVAGHESRGSKDHGTSVPTEARERDEVTKFREHVGPSLKTRVAGVMCSTESG